MVFYDIDKITYNPNCVFCNKTVKSSDTYNWSFLKKIFIINLIDRPDRKLYAESQAHQFGLCQYANFFRPERDPNGFINGCFESHRTICINSLNNDDFPILILEDDFYFNKNFTPKHLDIIVKHIDTFLPSNYETLFLGGYFIYLFPISTKICRVRGITTHSYIANKPFLEFIANTPFDKCKVRGSDSGIDIFYALKKKSQQFAVYPSICYQQELNSDHYKKNIWNTSNLFLNIHAMNIIPHFIIFIQIIFIFFVYINLLCNVAHKYNKYLLYSFCTVLLIFLLWIFLFQKNVLTRIFPI